ncbi:phosphatidylglycerophosphatase A [Rickettsia endosymbiont of Halotydeus destructor]|uniref:phosphatidylglycerophosphatase A family protein n=1 Tax=Rickettsia endosymbiont of Halotydeus destructor TaxID=2996754 RepID=UPI003BB0524D
MFTKKQIAEFFATFFYIGKIRYCPGTFGSLAAFPLYYIFMYFTITSKIIFSFPTFTLGEAQLVTLFIMTFGAWVMLLIPGYYFTKIYIEYNKQEDPKEVVIDEVIGQILTLILCFFSVIFVGESNLVKYLNPLTVNIVVLFILPFCLFRIFDIIKPWPINWLDRNIKGATGIILDDIVAAIFAAVIQYTIIFILIGWTH